MMSKRCKYALKAMVRLARNYKMDSCPLLLLHKRRTFPKISGTDSSGIKRAKLVNSKQGIGGGYYLLKSPDEVSLADLYRIFEEPISLTPCISLNYYEACDDCVDEEACYLRHELINVREKTRKSMMEATLTAFMNKK